MLQTLDREKHMIKDWRLANSVKMKHPIVVMDNSNHKNVHNRRTTTKCVVKFGGRSLTPKDINAMLMLPSLNNEIVLVLACAYKIVIVDYICAC
jgi:hypothetical protein